KDVVKPQYFTEAAVGEVVRMVLEHYRVYKSVPDMKIIPSIVRDAFDRKLIRQDLQKDVVGLIKEATKADLSNPGYMADKVADFARHQAIEQAMITALPLLEKKEWAKIAAVMNDAMKVGILEEGGDYDYWGEIETRTQRRHDMLAGR